MQCICVVGCACVCLIIVIALIGTAAGASGGIEVVRGESQVNLDGDYDKVPVKAEGDPANAGTRNE